MPGLRILKIPEMVEQLSAALKAQTRGRRVKRG